MANFEYPNKLEHGISQLIQVAASDSLFEPAISGLVPIRCQALAYVFDIKMAKISDRPTRGLKKSFLLWTITYGPTITRSYILTKELLMFTPLFGGVFVPQSLRLCVANSIAISRTFLPKFWLRILSAKRLVQKRKNLAT